MIGAGQCRIPGPFDPRCIWGAEDFLCLRFFDMPSCWINGLDGVSIFLENIYRKRIPSLPGVSRNCLQKMLLPPLNALHNMLLKGSRLQKTDRMNGVQCRDMTKHGKCSIDTRLVFEL